MKETACRDVIPVATRYGPNAFPVDLRLLSVDPSFGVMRRVFAFPTRKTRCSSWL